MMGEFNYQAAKSYNDKQDYDPWLVRMIEEAFGLPEDGFWDKAVCGAIYDYQEGRGLTADGMCGARTMRELSDDCEEIELYFEGREASVELMSRVYPQHTFILDISHHQDNLNTSADDIDWDLLMKTSGVRGLILKCSEGRTYTDPQFKEYLGICERRKIPWAAYHYGLFTHKRTGRVLNPIDQAKGTLQKMGEYAKTHRLFFDSERKTLKRARDAGMTSPEIVKFIKTWCDYIEKECGLRPGVYMSQGQIKEYLSLRDVECLLAERHTWWPYYPTTPFPFERRDTLPKHPEGCDWDLWQITGSGRAPGIDHKVDINVLNGGVKEFRDLFALTTERNCG